MRQDITTDALPPVYDLTPAALSVIEAFCAATPLTQDAVTIMGESVELLIESDQDRYFQEAGSQALSVDRHAQAVRDVVRANELLAGAVAILGYQAVDVLMRALPDPVLRDAA